MFKPRVSAKEHIVQLLTQTDGMVFPETQIIGLVHIHSEHIRGTKGPASGARLPRFPVALSQPLPCKRAEFCCTERPTGLSICVLLKITQTSAASF